MFKMTLVCHPEAKPKDLDKKEEILRFAQNDSKAVILLIWICLGFRD